MNTPSIEHLAKVLGCTSDQINSQFAKNARQLRAMHGQAVKLDHKFNGFTAVELDKLASNYERRAIKGYSGSN